MTLFSGTCWINIAHCNRPLGHALQNGMTVTTACYTLRRMANLAPDVVLPLVCQRFEVTREHRKTALSTCAWLASRWPAALQAQQMYTAASSFDSLATENCQKPRD